MGSARRRRWPELRWDVTMQSAFRRLGLAFLFAWSSTAPAQKVELQADVSKVTVKIELPKKNFHKGENITFVIHLINDGPGFYIPKFYSPYLVSGVDQLSGRPPQFGCSQGGAVGSSSESRSADQILREDYMWLGTGQTVGLQSQYPKCMNVSLLNEGTYQITSSFRGPKVPD